MTEIVAEEGGKLLAKWAGPLIGGAVVFAAGFGAAEAYEHKVPWGMAAHVAAAQAQIPAARDEGVKAGAAAQTDRDKPAFQAWADRLATCTADRQSDAKAAADAIAAARTRRDASSSAAYRLGRASCGASHATPALSPAAGPPGGLHDPADADDLRSYFPAAAASAGSGAVPAGGPVAPGR